MLAFALDFQGIAVGQFYTDGENKLKTTTTGITWTTRALTQ
jgi:hypothetical protein